MMATAQTANRLVRDTTMCGDGCAAEGDKGVRAINKI